MRFPNTTSALLSLCPFLTALLVGCSAERYKKSADREVYAIVASKRKAVTGAEEPFDLQRAPLPVTAAGRPGQVEDLKRTPPPQPVIERVEVSEEPPAPATPPAAPAPAAPPSATPEAPRPPPPPAAPLPGAGQAAPPPGPAPAAPPGPPTPPAPEAKGTAAAAAPEIEPPAPKVEAWILSLSDALRMALANNRDYQTQKESVYLQALALTLARWQFAPRFFGLISGDYVRDGGGSESGSISTDFGWNQLFASGARLSLAVANNFLQFFAGDRAKAANTVISGTLTQPLLRGFGRDIVTEPLIQAERDVIYQIRTFERYRQTFVVDVTAQYYRLLQARNRVSNEYLNWQGLVNNLGRAQALAEGGWLPKFEVDQVLQQELTARNRYAVAVEDYESSLDRFKITLDIPIDSSIGLDGDELVRLEVDAQRSIQINLEDAVATALRRRLDLQTARDRAEDAVRKVRVAANALRAQLDVNLTASLPSGGSSGAQVPLKFNAQRAVYGAGFDLNLPFDRRAERNAYAASIIDVEAEARAASLFEDQIRVTVRDSHRSLVRERETYDIQAASVKLAQARVESTGALRDAGRAETRDVLESQSALIEAKNGLTSALINLAIAKLEFHSDTGTLRVGSDGTWGVEAINPPENHG